jgi:hypothetical protein
LRASIFRTLASEGMPQASNCTIVGDSVAAGLGRALGQCGVAAHVGLSAEAAAARVNSTGNWVVASMGSNNFPGGARPHSALNLMLPFAKPLSGPMPLRGRADPRLAGERTARRALA